jgi:hypothetical protein
MHGEAVDLRAVNLATGTRLSVSMLMFFGLMSPAAL